MSTKPAVRLHLDRGADHARLVVEEDGKTITTKLNAGQLQKLVVSAQTIEKQLSGQEGGRAHDIKNIVPNVALEWAVLEVAEQPESMVFAFRTATGVHAAAILKAEERGDLWLADRVYSGVPASLFGRRQEIEIGPMSGLSNVIHWLRERRLDPEPALVQEVHDLAKRTNRILTDEEVQRAVARYRERVDGSAAPPTGRR